MLPGWRSDSALFSRWPGFGWGRGELGGVAVARGPPAGSAVFATMVVESPWAIGPVSGVPSLSVSVSGVLPSAWYKVVGQVELTVRSKVSAPNSPVLRTV